MAHILISDEIDAKSVDAIRGLGYTVDVKHYAPDELVQQIGPYHAIVVRSATKVTAPVIDAGRNLKLIVRGGVGVDNIDVAHAERQGVKVMNTPGASSDSVAELALGLMFAVARELPAATASMKAGVFDKKAFSKGMEVGGKVLGIIGMGRIGTKLAQKAASLGMRVIVAYDKFPEVAKSHGVPLLTKREVIEQADFLSLHVPYDKTAGPDITATEIGWMKQGAVLINCARGGVVDEQALLDALNAGKLRGAGIDVWVGEPSPRKDLVEHPKVVAAPHIGAATVEAQARVGGEVVQILKEFFG
ncbi:D-2-hydroxyacid dehydrogenase [candidate division KSB1 bacterium]|nr:D-2-hydroxyacid dehydrogenase [candidate division KSB1 bacterium]